MWCWSEGFGRKNVIRVLSGEGIMCVKYMGFRDRKRER